MCIIKKLIEKIDIIQHITPLTFECYTQMKVVNQNIQLESESTCIMRFVPECVTLVPLLCADTQDLVACDGEHVGSRCHV